jgi:hypothetical protein
LWWVCRLLNDAPKQDLQGVIQRINLLTALMRKQSGKVIWIRHCGKAGDGFERHTERWSFLPELSCHGDDVVIEKKLNDPFVGTALRETLERIAPDRSSSPAVQLTLVSTRPSDRLFQTITTSLLLAMATQLAIGPTWMQPP